MRQMKGREIQNYLKDYQAFKQQNQMIFKLEKEKLTHSLESILSKQ